MTEDCKRIKNVWLCFGGGGWVSACIGTIHLMLVSLARTLAMEGSGKCCPRLVAACLDRAYRFDRRFRVYDISDYGETIRTYKRTEHDEVLDEYILAGAGAPPYN